MISNEDIHAMADRIVAAVHPQRIVLFGSYARGTAHADSDVDLLVVMPYTGRPIDAAASILAMTHAGFPVDLLVRRAEDVTERYLMGDPLIRDIVDHGRCLYEAAA